MHEVVALVMGKSGNKAIESLVLGKSDATAVNIESLVLGKSDNKVDIDERDDMGWTPLMWAVDAKEKDAALFLAKMAGALILKNPGVGNAPDKYGDTPLVMAVKKGELEVTEALLKGKADPNAQVTEALLKGKADPNTQGVHKETALHGVHKETALHWAAKRGHEDVCRLLIQYKASIKLKDDGDTTPADWARSKYLKEVIQPPKIDTKKVTTKAGREQAKRFKQGLQALKGGTGTKKVKKKKKPEDGADPAAAENKVKKKKKPEDGVDPAAAENAEMNEAELALIKASGLVGAGGTEGEEEGEDDEEDKASGFVGGGGTEGEEEGEEEEDDKTPVEPVEETPVDPVEEARRIFKMFDEDNSGSIDRGELFQALKAMGQDVTEDDVAKMLAVLTPKP
ncbi:ankyrin repeat-containing domain protein [Baffinella frigidus]|nr:ankyrin repeat-containing domain protein [Cryptophyta sp. CCMP2293]